LPLFIDHIAATRTAFALKKDSSRLTLKDEPSIDPYLPEN